MTESLTATPGSTEDVTACACLGHWSPAVQCPISTAVHITGQDTETRGRSPAQGETVAKWQDRDMSSGLLGCEAPDPCCPSDEVRQWQRLRMSVDRSDRKALTLPTFMLGSRDHVAVSSVTEMTLQRMHGPSNCTAGPRQGPWM